MEDTMMLVANLRKVHPLESNPINFLKEDPPEEEENGVGDFPPTSTDDLDPRVSVRGIEFEFGRELMGSPRVQVSFPTSWEKGKWRLPERKAKLEPSRQSRTTTDRRFRTYTPQH
jgi:hypothetical protein